MLNIKSPWYDLWRRPSISKWAIISARYFVLIDATRYVAIIIDWWTSENENLLRQWEWEETFSLKKDFLEFYFPKMNWNNQCVVLERQTEWFISFTSWLSWDQLILLLILGQVSCLQRISCHRSSYRSISCLPCLFVVLQLLVWLLV